MRLDTNAKLIFCKSKFGENVENENFKTTNFGKSMILSALRIR